MIRSSWTVSPRSVEDPPLTQAEKITLRDLVMQRAEGDPVHEMARWRLEKEGLIDPRPEATPGRSRYARHLGHDHADDGPRRGRAPQPKRGDS